MHRTLDMPRTKPPGRSGSQLPSCRSQLHSRSTERVGIVRRAGGIPMLRRTFLTGALPCATVSSLLSLACAQQLAGKQIRLIVPFPAGGPTDIVARPLAQQLGEALKATIVIDNRAGAGGSIGADAVAKASADGTTLLVGTVGTHAIN